MKLYMILYVANVVAGSFGPLPYSVAECQLRAQEATLEIHEKAVLHPEVKVKPDEWEFVCVELDPSQRPHLGDKR